MSQLADRIYGLFRKVFPVEVRETVATIQLTVQIYKVGNWVGNEKVIFEYRKGGMNEFDRDCVGEGVQSAVNVLLEAER